ncbi:uncharacterized protein PAC_04075 [Phialocephala subalpina]|uniref:Uncharacterized protein n=1 Tax=Phialocephala subalpina TaxID=576137 RepID=A0A1L7WN55_9HELO|nr:uncharacterized protein PAC_04075 [Phialocephala subalpina]
MDRRRVFESGDLISQPGFVTIQYSAAAIQEQVAAGCLKPPTNHLYTHLYTRGASHSQYGKREGIRQYCSKKIEDHKKNGKENSIASHQFAKPSFPAGLASCSDHFTTFEQAVTVNARKRNRKEVPIAKVKKQASAHLNSAAMKAYKAGPRTSNQGSASALRVECDSSLDAYLSRNKLPPSAQSGQVTSRTDAVSVPPSRRWTVSPQAKHRSTQKIPGVADFGSGGGMKGANGWM